jgi:hypothetical protein
VSVKSSAHVSMSPIDYPTQILYRWSFGIVCLSLRSKVIQVHIAGISAFGGKNLGVWGFPTTYCNFVYIFFIFYSYFVL